MKKKRVSLFIKYRIYIFVNMDADSILTTLKLLIIGESGVGKSSLLLRFTDDAFDPEQAATIGVDFKVKTVNVNASKVMIHRTLHILINEHVRLFIFHKIISVKFYTSTCIIMIGEAGDLGHCWSRKIPNIDAELLQRWSGKRSY